MSKINRLRFTKMHGAGNDYIYINCLESVPENLPELSIIMSDRHTGVGGDGIILILPSKVADFKMRIFNADGSEARMCGNGSRCVGKYVYDNGLTDKTEISLETLAGIRTLSLHVGPDNKVHEVTVDMGKPIMEASIIPVISESVDFVSQPVKTTADGDLNVTAVSMGNPHGVVIVEDISEINFEKTGPELENHSIWPDRANIEFTKVISPNELQVRVWERGSGETMACGTGACAATVAAITLGLINRKATVHLRGGDLNVEWADDGHVYMRGPAVTVFEGTYEYPTL